MKQVITVVVVAGLVAGCSRWASPPRYGSLSFDTKRRFEFNHGIEVFRVDNGLRFALRPDPRAPIATVDVRYDVGAAADPPGRAGLAHLVEHLMFEQREQPSAPPMSALIDQIAISYNATTSWDGTHYTITVPKDRVAAAMTLEARRMNTRCEHLTDADIARERDVVRAENAQRASGSLREQLSAAIYGADHPYARPVSTDQIADVTRAEICKFITDHYAPDRAVLVVTGDFDPDKLRGLIGRTFGMISRKAAAPPVAAHPAPDFAGERVEVTARVKRPVAMVAFRAPVAGAAGTAVFEEAQSLISIGLEQADANRSWITDSSVMWLGDARAMVLVAGLEVTDAAQLPAAYEEIYAWIDRLKQLNGPALGELSTSMALSYMARWDNTARRGDWIARYLQYADHQAFMIQELREVAVAWPTAFAQYSHAFAPGETRQIAVLPGGGAPEAGRTLALAERDLHVWRTPVDPGEADRPAEVVPSTLAIERYQLGNGLNVELVPDDDGAVLESRLVFPVGSAHSDPTQPMVPYLAASLLAFDSEGYYTAEDYRRIVWATERGTSTDTDVTATSTTFSARGLYHFGDWHLWHLSALIDKGRYASLTINETRALGRRLAKAADERGAERDDEFEQTFLERLFGAGHPFTRVERGDQGLAGLTSGQLAAWKRAYYRPRGATLIVTGRFDRAKIKREIEELFAPWDDVAPAALPAIPSVTPTSRASWFAAVAPSATQVSATIAFALSPSVSSGAGAVLAEMMNDELRDVREGMAASYGVYAGAFTSANGGYVRAYGRVDRGRAGPAVKRMLDAIDRLRTDPAARRAAFVRARRKLVRELVSLPAGAWAVAERRVAAAAAGTGAAPVDAEVQALAAITLAEIEAIIARELDPARQVVALTGTRADLDAAYGELGQTPEVFVPTPATSTVVEALDKAVTAASDPPDPDFQPLRVGADADTGLYHGGQQVSRDQFLRLADRADVISRMRTRFWLRIGLAVGGVATVATGLVVAFTPKSCEGLSFDAEQACQDDNEDRRSLGGFITIGGGALLVAAHFLSNRAPSRDELRDISADHNRRRGRRRRAAIAPVVTDREVGLTVRVAF